MQCYIKKILKFVQHISQNTAPENSIFPPQGNYAAVFLKSSNEVIIGGKTYWQCSIHPLVLNLLIQETKFDQKGLHARS